MINAAQTCLSNRTSRPAGMRASRATAFTLIELLVVIGIIALLAALVVGGTKYTGTKMKENRVRTELKALLTAIEAYHAKFNHYPPDHVDPITKMVNPVTNSLYYELTGVIVEDRPTGGTFRSPNRSERINPSVLPQYFGVDGIENAATTAKEVKPFISLKSGQYAAIKAATPNEAELDVLVVPVPWPLNRTADQPTTVPGLNPWRYVSTQPTNNPASFDLWAEYVEGGKVKVICNWSEGVLERGQ